MNKLSTVRTENDGPFRSGRCDDNGYQQVILVTNTEAGSNPNPVTFPAISPIDKSGTITLGGTAQVLMAANASRRGFSLQNTSSFVLYINVTNSTASVSSLQIPAGALYESPLGGCTNYAISIFGATTGQAFVATEW